MKGGHRIPYRVHINILWKSLHGVHLPESFFPVCPSASLKRRTKPNPVKAARHGQELQATPCTVPFSTATPTLATSSWSGIQAVRTTVVAGWDAASCSRQNTEKGKNVDKNDTDDYEDSQNFCNVEQPGLPDEG